MGSVTNWPGHGVLQVSVPELEAWIIARTRHYDPRYVSVDPSFHHAHITVLAPLSAWRLDAIAQIAATTRPFDYTLDELDVFPNGCIHLPPEPNAPFRTLTRRVWQAHPGVVPYGAPDPEPHLTLDMLAEDITITSTRVLLADTIPVACRAEALDLVWYEADNCHLIERWPLNATT